jgi:PDZ domain-containing protein 8
MNLILSTTNLFKFQDLDFNDSVTFHIGDNIKYFNFGVWSTQSSSAEGKDVLLGHISIPMHKIVEKCTITGLGHLIKKWQLLEPCTVTYAEVSFAIALLNLAFNCSKTHSLNEHSGFDNSFCYGDALFCFVLVQDSQSEGYIPSSTRASFSMRGDGEGLPETPVFLSPAGKDSPAHEPATPSTFSASTEDLMAHDFIRTHFSRTTQCDFCSKKVCL